MRNAILAVLLGLVPAFAGAQGLPSANQVYAGPTGGSPSVPSFRSLVPGDLANSLNSQALDAQFGSTRGSILERGASGWGTVTPGTSGLPWVSNGTGADPAYGPLNDTSEVAGSAGSKYNSLFFGNAGTGVVHRFNRIFCGEATASSSDIGPVTTKDWLETLLTNTTASAQFVCVDTTGSLGVVGASRTSDSKIAFGSTSGGSQGGTFVGLNDDVTPSTTPIACGNCPIAIAKGKQSTVTISNASPAVVTWTNHGLAVNTRVIFTSTGSLPTGLTAGTTYFVLAAGLTASAFEVSLTQGGAAVNTSSAGSGTFTATAATNGLTVNQVDVDNSGSLVTPTPFGGVTSGFTGNLFTPGAYSGLVINNVSAAMAIGAGVINGCAGVTCRFEKGFIAFDGSLNTANGAGGDGVAIELARNMSMRWLNSGGGTDGEIWANASGVKVNQSLTANSLTLANTPLAISSGGTGGTGVPSIIPLSSGQTAVTQASTRFFVSTQDGGNGEGTVLALCPRNGTFKNLYVQTNGLLGGSGQTAVFTWRINAADTAVTCTINSGANTCNDTTHTAACTPGQPYDVKVVTSAATGNVQIGAGIEFDAQ